MLFVRRKVGSWLIWSGEKEVVGPLRKERRLDREEWREAAQVVSSIDIARAWEEEWNQCFRALDGAMFC